MDTCSKCGTVHPPKVRQCEGCSAPLESYLEAYENGCLKVEWTLCRYHDDVVTFSPHSEY